MSKQKTSTVAPEGTELDTKRRVWELAKKDILLAIIAGSYVTLLTKAVFDSSMDYSKVMDAGIILIVVGFISAIKNIGLHFTDLLFEERKDIRDNQIKEDEINREMKQAESDAKIKNDRVHANFQMNSIATNIAIGAEFFHSILNGAKTYMSASPTPDTKVIISYQGMMGELQDFIKTESAKIKLPWTGYVEDYFGFAEEKEPSSKNVPVTNEDVEIIQEVLKANQPIDIENIAESVKEVQNINPTHEELKETSIDEYIDEELSKA